jgi:hypothetical protein
MSDRHITIEMPATRAHVRCDADGCELGVRRVTIYPQLPDDADPDDIDLPDCAECGGGLTFADMPAASFTHGV